MYKNGHNVMAYKISDIDSCSQGAIARVFAVRRQAVAQWRGCPRNDDDTYSLPAVVAWKLGLAAADSEMGDGDSPALERFRAAKADLAELDREQRIGNLCRRETVREALVAFGQTLRVACDVLVRRYGNDAADILAHALDDAARAAQGILQDHEPKPE